MAGVGHDGMPRSVAGCDHERVTEQTHQRLHGHPQRRAPAAAAVLEEREDSLGGARWYLECRYFFRVPFEGLVRSIHPGFAEGDFAAHGAAVAVLSGGPRVKPLLRNEQGGSVRIQKFQELCLRNLIGSRAAACVLE